MITLDKIIGEIRQYCEYNNISDIELFLSKCLMTGFNIERYGLSPNDNFNRERGTVVESISSCPIPDEKTEAVVDVSTGVTVEKSETPKKKTTRKRTIKEKKQ